MWGPYHDALSLNTWRLTVTRVQPHVFHWVFEGKDKSLGDDAFLTVISGTHTAAVDAMDDPIEGFGNGDFTIDWNKAAMLPAARRQRRRGGVHLLAPHDRRATVTIDVDFTGIQDETTKEIFDAKYRYTSTPGQGGTLRYAEDKDNVPGPGRHGHGEGALHDREPLDRGRRGPLRPRRTRAATSRATVAHGSECWDDRFDSVYRYLEYPDADGQLGRRERLHGLPRCGVLQSLIQWEPWRVPIPSE